MSAKQLVLGASGIYVSYLTISLFSQKLFSIPYASITNPGQSAKFTYPGLIVWFSCLLCAIFGFVKGKVAKEVPSPIPLKEQMLLGFLSTINMVCANYALVYITFLEQNLGRNCRYLLVVINGAYFSRVKKGSNLKIPGKKVIVATLITTGVLLFTAFGGKSGGHGKQQQGESSQKWIGYLMLSLSIVADALFSDSQAFSKANFKPTANHLFTCASVFSFVYVFLISLVSGQAIEQIKFCMEHPSVMLDILLMGVLQVVGQVSIYYVVANFKQHIFPLISTTRKVLSVFLSIMIFGHHLNLVQWGSIALVFIGLAYELNEELNHKKSPEKEKQVKESKQDEKKDK